MGACIQCSIKTCKTAYHVTCAFKYGLEMKAIIEDEMADDGVKLRVHYFNVHKISKYRLKMPLHRKYPFNSKILFLVILSKAQ